MKNEMFIDSIYFILILKGKFLNNKMSFFYSNIFESHKRK